MRTVIFDLDGTLADTSADLIEAANACFRDLGHDDVLDVADDGATAVRGGRAMLVLGFQRLGVAVEEADLVAQYPLLLAHYGGRIDVHTRLYPGVEAACNALLETGYRLGICTNKPEGLADTLLRRLGVRDLFGSLIGADTLPVRKPDPAPYRAAVEQTGGSVALSLLIGDTETDRKTARAAGVPCVLVSFGPGGDSVRALAPEAFLGHYDELGNVVRGLIG